MRKKIAYFKYFFLQFPSPIWCMSYKSSCTTQWYVSTLRSIECREQSNVQNGILKMQLNCNFKIKLQSPSLL